MTKEDKEGYILKISEHPVVKQLAEVFINRSDVHLIGGAVLDIMEDREIKDFDLLGWGGNTAEILVKNGFTFVSDTKTAVTFEKEDVILQLLKITKEEFDFTISQTRFNFRSKILNVDEVSFDSKILIPVSYERRGQVMATLKRIPHYLKKGYRIPEVTYLSLLNTMSKVEKSHS